MLCNIIVVGSEARQNLARHTTHAKLLKFSQTCATTPVIYFALKHAQLYIKNERSSFRSPTKVLNYSSQWKKLGLFHEAGG